MRTARPTEQSKRTAAVRRIFPVPKIAGNRANIVARQKARNAPEGDMTINPARTTRAAVMVRARADAGCMAFMRAHCPGQDGLSMAPRCPICLVIASPARPGVAIQVDGLLRRPAQRDSSQ